MNIKALVSFGVFALCLATSAAPLRAVTPTAWNGDPGCWQMKRHVEKMAAVTNGGAQVVFIGDSITHFWETRGRAQWEKWFASGRYRALNLGTSADRTEHVLWRLTAGRELDGYEAKCILLMIGTNNSGHFPFAEEPPVDTILGIREILNVIAEKQPRARTILTAIFPRGTGPGDAHRVRNDVVNKEISKFADGKRVIWCDFSDKFLDAEGRLSPELFPDLLHPNARGYEIWASAVLPVIDAVLKASADEAVPSVWPSSPRGYSYEFPHAVRPTAMFPKGNWWETRCLEKRREIAANDGKEYDAVMVGDSITHILERDGGTGRVPFGELKKDYRILNLGYGGDQTQHVIWRLENGELEGYKAKLFTVLIGTNNRDRNPADTAAGVKRIVETIRAKHPESKIVLMAVFPRGATPADERRVANEKVNALIRPLADGDTVRWLDINAKFLDGDGNLTKDMMYDLLHPTAKGYEIWLDALRPVLAEVCGR